AVGSAQYSVATAAPGGQSGEQLSPLVGQVNVARTAGFRSSDCDSPSVGIKVAGFEAHQLAIAAAGLQRRLHQQPEFWIGGGDAPDGLRYGQIADARGVDRFVWLDLAPRGVGLDLAFGEGVIERRAHDRPCAVRRCSPGAPPVAIVTGVAIFLLLAV